MEFVFYNLEFYQGMDFVGNIKAFELLKNSLERGHLNHAYLFSGPEHIGKFTLAKIFALHTIDSTSLGLNLNDVSNDAKLDLIIVQPEIVQKNNISKQRDISIESIREAKQSLSLFPYHGKYKILVIDDAHRMTNGCQNALLKILEEPNPTTMIILVTHEVDRILPTILSRLQVVNFGLVDDGEMKKAFAEDFSFQQDCVELSIGRPGLAKFLNENIEEKNFRIDALMELEKLKKGTLNEKFKLAEDLSKDAVRTLDKLNVWIWELRKDIMSVDKFKNRKAYDDIEKIQKSMATLKRSNANSRLVLEVLFMDL